MVSPQARAVVAFPRAAVVMAGGGGGRGGAQVAALRAVHRMLVVQLRFEYYNGGGGGGGEGGQQRRHKARATRWDRQQISCGTRRHFQTAPPAPRPSPEQSLPSEVPPGTLPSDHDSIFPGVTPSHASLQKPSIAGGAQFSTPLPPPPGFQADSRASSTVAVTPQTKPMAGSVGSSRAKQPPASTNDRGVSNLADALPLDTELHRELGAAIAAAATPGVVHPDPDTDSEEVLKAGASTSALDFNDTAASYTSFTNLELIRAYFVLRACAIRPLVENSEALLKIGYGVFGETLTHFVLGKTFFAHFCAGETAEQVGRRAGDLQKVGIGGILDYAAEVDLRPAEERAEREAKKRAAGDNKLLLVEPAECRTYDYMGEAACDARMMTFLACVRAVRDQTPGGFSAVKLTALGDPVLLSQLTTCVHLVRGLFEDFDGNRDGVVSRAEFEEGYRRWFRSESKGDRATLARTMKQFDLKNTGGIDYVEWSNRMRLDNLAEITVNCRNRGPLAAAALGENGVALKDAMQRRISTLATAAATAEVRLMIDAEQSWLQPAIDNTVYGLQREFNKEFPTIFTTYQCYLKDSLERLVMDLDRASRGGFGGVVHCEHETKADDLSLNFRYVWAGKLVRGAYMVSEREKANDEGYESPVFETIEETHANYDAAIAVVLEHMAAGNRAEVMIATHNQASIEHAVSLMRKLGIRRRDGVSFGQLLGMADNITFPLGTGGYKAYKYIPYGKVGETIPYLVRRAQENSGMLSGASHERGLLVKEIKRRVMG